MNITEEEYLWLCDWRKVDRVNDVPFGRPVAERLRAITNDVLQARDRFLLPAHPPRRFDQICVNEMGIFLLHSNTRPCKTI